MKTWFIGLSVRERVMVLLAAITVVGFILYTMVWSPLLTRNTTLESRVNAQRAELAWMRRAAAEVQRLRAGMGRAQGEGHATSTDKGAGASLLSQIAATARTHHLDGALSRIQPEGTTGVRLWLDNAPFDQILPWLDGLVRRQGVVIHRLTLERQSTPGRVDARVWLKVKGG